LHIANKLLRIALLEKLAIKSTYDSDMYNRAFPVGNALFLFVGSVMSLFRLPRQARVCAATKAPLGLSLLRCASQTRTFENTPLLAVCKKKRGKLWQRERGLDGASPLDKEKHKTLYYNKAIRT
jgi:hypothetical protein